MSETLFAMKGVTKYFHSKPPIAEKLLSILGQGRPRKTLKAVDGVDLHIYKGEVLGLVGESGCGKSTLARMATGIYQPTSGEISYKNRPILDLKNKDKLDFLLKVQMIFQDPYASLDPRMSVGQIIAEALKVHKLLPKNEISGAVSQSLEEVGLDLAYIDRYPHQFSGGQRQRIGIARALAVKPEFLVCDEPVSALDVSIQAQVINLFMKLRARYDLTYLFVSHDLGVVRHISDRIAVMYLGRIVEIGNASALFNSPAHPYTQALLAASPSIKRRKRDFEPLRGELPSPLSPPSGCPFHTRCPQAMAICKEQRPELKSINSEQTTACHLYDGETK